jgi:outer membrane protein OmpA-like peptidoglycan-associated protein
MSKAIQLLAVAIAGILLSQSTISAQTPSSTERYGLFGGYNINFHSADFRALPGVPNCCPKFESGSGGGLAFGAIYEMAISRKFWLTFQAGFATLGATLKRSEYVPALRVADDYLFPEAEISHRITAQLSSMGIAPMITANPVGGLRFHAGMEIAFLGAIKYDQVEEMMVDGLVFKENLKRTRNEFSGELGNVSAAQSSIVLGTSLELPLNRSRSMFLAPQALFRIGLTNLTESESWKANSFQFGIAVKFAPQSTPPATQERPSSPQVIIPPPVADVPVNSPKTPTMPLWEYQTYGVSEKGEQFGLDEIRVEEFISTQLKPLLPYIFFDEGASEIPERYVRITPQSKGDFMQASTINLSTLDVYYQSLNIIGKRMSEHPTASIKLTGCNAGAADEGSTKSLSAKRAEAIKKYLVTVWNIAGNRIKTESRGLPANASRSIDADASASEAENRRVEFSSDNAAILAPVISRDTLRNTYPKTIRLVNTSGKQWSANLFSKGKQLATLTSSAGKTIEWHPADYAASLGESVEVSANAEGWVPAQSTIPVELLTLRRKREEQMADKTIDKYSLIVFDFDRSDLSSQNKSIATIIKNALTPQSKVSISGTTDQLGDATYNRKLSLDRARATANVLGVPNAELSGDGESDIFPNTLPEGRFYNRTVVITVETPK